MVNSFKLPRKYISHSQMTCWQQSKDLYRQKYYYQSKELHTPEIDFGKEIATYLETQKIKGVKQYRKSEHKIEVEIGGFMILGYIDSFCPRWKKFLEYKTSREDVKDSWSLTKVQKHKQLDFYSMLIQEKYGKVHDECELIVLETTDKINYKGRNLKGKLRLTGKVISYKRKIEQWERDYMKEQLLKTAKEIAEDYQKHLKAIKEDVPFI